MSSLEKVKSEMRVAVKQANAILAVSEAIDTVLAAEQDINVLTKKAGDLRLEVAEREAEVERVADILDNNMAIAQGVLDDGKLEANTIVAKAKSDAAFIAETADALVKASDAHSKKMKAKVSDARKELAQVEAQVVAAKKSFEDIRSRAAKI